MGVDISKKLERESKDDSGNAIWIKVGAISVIVLCLIAIIMLGMQLVNASAVRKIDELQHQLLQGFRRRNAQIQRFRKQQRNRAMARREDDEYDVENPRQRNGGYDRDEPRGSRDVEQGRFKKQKKYDRREKKDKKQRKKDKKNKKQRR